MWKPYIPYINHTSAVCPHSVLPQLLRSNAMFTPGHGAGLERTSGVPHFPGPPGRGQRGMGEETVDLPRRYQKTIGKP